MERLANDAIFSVTAVGVMWKASKFTKNRKLQMMRVAKNKTAPKTL